MEIREKNFSGVIGADISKKSIDLFYHFGKQHLKISNDNAGYRQLLSWLQQQHLGEYILVVIKNKKISLFP